MFKISCELIFPIYYSLEFVSCTQQNSKWISKSEKKLKTEEKNIISLLKSRNESGMSLLYDKYSGPLYGIIRRIMYDEQIAQDALQDTFVKIWKNFDKYDQEKSQLFTWMYSIARNTALDYRRKINKIYIDDIQNQVDNVLLSTSMNEEALDIRQKLDNIENKYKEVIDALFFQGYSQREWSKESGTPLGTVKSRLRVGMRMLKEIYDKGVLLFFILLNAIL